ncbi:hypothetical protein [Streptomyces reniochalinae]|uniref:DUF4355 domain-containing protein n=1 Tax=Streptomyces reniochalinae TaxID=2250578 RepID=A0A367EIE5_9ACTN|nr:hypothetical protein [Streptomyces reniochalinae]RCG16990.1 hypothetical protein DQ392_18090 [Streptomyces reniochalinae]
MADETTDEKTTEEAKPGTDEGSGTAETSTETTTETAGGESGGSGEDTAAELERLRAQLAEVAPIVQAHKDAEEARKTEEQKLREALESAERERDEASRVLMRREVADETGLSPAVVDLLTGATKDELLKAANEVVSHTKGRVGTRPAPKVGGGKDAVKTDDDIDPVALAKAIAKRARF